MTVGRLSVSPSAAGPADARRRRPGRRVLAVAAAVAAVGLGAALVMHQVLSPHQPGRVHLPLHQIGVVTLPGDSSRFDYASLDPAGHQLFIAHLGASEVIEVDTSTNQVVRSIRGIEGVHGVLVVPSRHRVYATATATNQVVTLDEDTGRELGRAPTGAFPDGIAYEPDTATVWVTNETGGSETVVDAGTGYVRGTVMLGGDAGNVAVDPAGPGRPARVLVDVQTRETVAVIDPRTLGIVARSGPLPKCQNDHGLQLDPAQRLAFVACDANNELLVLDLDTLAVRQTLPVGDGPDVLAYDAGHGRLYVAAESGWLSVFEEHDRQLQVAGQDHLAGNAHVVAVDSATGLSYYPVPHDPAGFPVLLVESFGR